MKSLTAAATLCGLVLCSSVFADESPAKPKELDTLGQYVGHWTSDVTNKPAVWDQKGTTFRTVNQAELILDGWFLQHIEVNHVGGDPDKVTKSLFLWTYDPKLQKYVAWAFQSTGKAVSWTGKWDSTNKAFTLATVEPPPNTTGKMTEQFLDAKAIKGNLTFIDDGGKILMDMVWTRIRQSEIDGTATREQWSKSSTPIQPLPDELIKLQPFIGEWDVEFIDGFSAVAPGGGTSKGKMTAQWILDCRFLLGTTEQGKNRSLWIIGYDPDKKRYRRIQFTNAGEIEEALGGWNGEFATIDWYNHSKRPGINTSTTEDYIGVGVYRDGSESLHTHFLKRNENENLILRSLTTKSTRRK